jgi:hypothetical protein
VSHALAIRLEHERKIHRNHHVFGIVRQVIRVSPWITLCVCGLLGVQSIAGKETIFSPNIRAVIELGANKYFFLMVAILAGGTYWAKDHLGRRTIRSIYGHTRQLEKRFDKHRTSSRLMADGRPTPEDLDDA